MLILAPPASLNSFSRALCSPSAGSPSSNFLTSAHFRVLLAGAGGSVWVVAFRI